MSSPFLGPSWKSVGGYERTPVGNYARFPYLTSETAFIDNISSGGGAAGPVGSMSVYQPNLITSPYNLPNNIFNTDGQQLMLINNINNTNNLQTVSTTNFKINTQVYSQLFMNGQGGYLVAGFNSVSGTCEVRMGLTISNCISNNISLYSVIIFNTGTSYVNAIFFDPLYPNIAIIGGLFNASQGVAYSPSGGTYLSNVNNILVISTALSTGIIFPYNMNNNGIYGLNDEVKCFSNYQVGGVMFGTTATNRYVIIGGKFTNTISPLAGGDTCELLAQIQIDNIANGAFIIDSCLGQLSWNNASTNIINFVGIQSDYGNQNTNTLIVIAGNMVGGGAQWGGQYFCATTWQVFNGTGNWISYFFNAPYNSVGSVISAGVPANFGLSNTSWILSIYNVTTSLFDVVLLNMPLPPSFNSSYNVIKQNLTSGAFSFAVDKTQLYPLSLKYAIGGSAIAGFPAYVFNFNNNQNIQLDGATNFGNNWYDSNNQVFYLFRDPNSSNTVANENYSLDVAQMVINTTNVLPFVNALTPDVKNQTIILNKMNNYAMGSLVGVATNDIRILITSFNGAAFSN